MDEASFECQIRLEHVEDVILSIDVTPTDLTFEGLLLEIGRLTCSENKVSPAECLVEDVVSIKYCGHIEQHRESWIPIYTTEDLQLALKSCQASRCIKITANIVVLSRIQQVGNRTMNHADLPQIFLTRSTQENKLPSAAASSKNTAIGRILEQVPAKDVCFEHIRRPATPRSNSNMIRQSNGENACDHTAIGRAPSPNSIDLTGGEGSELRLSKIAIRILQSADSLRGGPSEFVSRKLVGLLNGATDTSGGAFSTGLKELRELGFLIVHSGPPRFSVTPGGAAALTSRDLRIAAISSNDQVLDHVLQVLLKKKAAKPHQRRIMLLFGVLKKGQQMSRHQLASEANQASLSQGPPVTALKFMFDVGIVEYPGRGLVRMTDDMFPFGR